MRFAEGAALAKPRRRPYVAREHLLTLLARATRQLTPLQTEVIWRRELAQWPWSSVAYSLARTEDSVKKAHARALKNIRRTMGAD